MPSNILIPKDEKDDYYSDDDLFRISSWGADLSFRELIDRYNDDELIKPEMQRKYVWDKTEASRFIDSLLLGLPVPSIFLAKTHDEKMLIIDGYQRIMTVHDFVRGIFSRDGKVFKLSNSDKINARWRGKAFSELSSIEQRKIKNTTIHAIIFVQDHPSDDNTSLFQVFERINTSGRSLMPQEIRNCVYQGPMNALLLSLNNNTNWRNLFGEEDQRMRDVELILRFFALRHLTQISGQHKEKISLKKYLNQYMAKANNFSQEEIMKLKSLFENTMFYIENNFGKTAFHNISPSDPTRTTRTLSPTVFDSISIATANCLESNKKLKQGDPRNNRISLLLNKDFKNAISQETMNTSSIYVRISCAIKYLFE